MVACVVLGHEAEALDFAPWPGELGERVLANVSKPGWEQWLARQTMLLNEKRLSPMDPAHRAYLATQMEAFFFGDGGDEPEGWVAPLRDLSLGVCSVGSVRQVIPSTGPRASRVAGVSSDFIMWINFCDDE
ncbi:MAG: hypothetical protein CM1200mP41_17590 [Gammaproteobacteria bacterium]|nr:MAG: hypothetical protein CM1200mP41_17590 [Gammaproteobacteria bacterium]